MQELPQFAEMPESVRAVMKSSIEQAKKAFDSFIGASQKAMQGVEASSSAPVQGVKELNEKIAEYTRLNADANFQYAMKLADTRQLSDVVELQNAHVRETMDRFTKQLEDLRELMTEAMKQSAQNVTSNMPKL
jgi:phasin